MAAASSDPIHDKAMLLISLAEEYFESAHNLAPSVVFSMTDADVHAYEKLVATGLGCLDTALKNVRLPPRLEANIRLRYAGVLFEETNNNMEGETALSKGIALCERVWKLVSEATTMLTYARITTTTSSMRCSSSLHSSWPRRTQRLP